MRYYVDLFSPETAMAFDKSDKKISGFRITKKAYVYNQKIAPGDKMICYVTRLQRFIGVLEIRSDPYEDDRPIFAAERDPFILRFKVEPIVWLPLEYSIPIHSDFIWNELSFTKGLDKGERRWTYRVFSSPNLWPYNDCVYLEKVLSEQALELVNYPFSEEDQSKLKVHKIRISDNKEVSVSVPDEEDTSSDESEKIIEKEERKSVIVQAKLAEIGEVLGFKIWIPIPDRNRVLEKWKPRENALLEELPLVFDETTLKTIRNIDVLWIDRRSIVRAFEVEDTTSIYSGILRMADLLALQPMLNIKIHIVAPTERREAVFTQINRPVFADIGGRTLSETCSYIPYESVLELANEKKLKYMNDTIIDDFAQYVED